MHVMLVKGCVMHLDTLIHSSPHGSSLLPTGTQVITRVSGDQLLDIAIREVY
jgi:hypothetical protein